MSYVQIIQNVIDFIDENLKESLTLEGIASKCHFSIPHFYRLFQIFTGYSVMDYVRKRRLSQAALELVNSDRRLIDISLDYNFESQEAFIRSFKAIFGQTPGEYRKAFRGIGLFSKLQLTEYPIDEKSHSILHIPSFVEREFILLGFESEINFNSDFTKTIIDLQEKLLKKLNQSQLSSYYSSSKYIAYWHYKWNENSQSDAPAIYYFAGIEAEASEFLDGFELKKLPRSNYAKFNETHRGEIAGPDGYAYRAWLPSFKGQLNEAIPGDLEVYPNLTEIGPNSPCQIYIPIC